MITKFGFKLSRDSAKKPLAVQAFSDAGTLAAAAATQNDPTHFTAWFGGGIPGGGATIQTYSQRMADFLNSTGITITLEVGSPEGAVGESFAACDAQKYRGDKKFGEDYVSQWKASCGMLLGPNFFSDKVSRGERAQTILHEVSHLVLATTDEKVTIGGKTIDAYGADNCLELVKTATAKARQNAENWGYYLVAYRDGLGWTAEECKYLTAEQCAAVRGKRFR